MISEDANLTGVNGVHANMCHPNTMTPFTGTGAALGNPSACQARFHSRATTPQAPRGRDAGGSADKLWAQTEGACPTSFPWLKFAPYTQEGILGSKECVLPPTTPKTARHSALYAGVPSLRLLPAARAMQLRVTLHEARPRMTSPAATSARLDPAHWPPDPSPHARLAGSNKLPV